MDEGPWRRRCQVPGHGVRIRWNVRRGARVWARRLGTSGNALLSFDSFPLFLLVVEKEPQAAAAAAVVVGPEPPV